MTKTWPPVMAIAEQRTAKPPVETESPAAERDAVNRDRSDRNGRVTSAWPPPRSRAAERDIEDSPGVGLRPDHEADLGSAQQVAGDLRVAFLVLNEARYRTMERIFGVPRADANLATLLAAAVLANAVHGRAQRVFGRRPGPADALLGAAAAREVLVGAAGRSTHEEPVSGTLIALVVLAGLGAPTLRRAARRARSGSRRLRLAFNRRYWRPETPLTPTQDAGETSDPTVKEPH